MVPENIHTIGRSLELPSGKGLSKAKLLKQSEAKLEFTKGWGRGGRLKPKTFCGGGVDIFWNNTI